MGEFPFSLLVLLFSASYDRDHRGIFYFFLEVKYFIAIWRRFIVNGFVLMDNLVSRNFIIICTDMILGFWSKITSDLNYGLQYQGTWSRSLWTFEVFFEVVRVVFLLHLQGFWFGKYSVNLSTCQNLPRVLHFLANLSLLRNFNSTFSHIYSKLKFGVACVTML